MGEGEGDCEPEVLVHEGDRVELELELILSIHGL